MNKNWIIRIAIALWCMLIVAVSVYASESKVATAITSAALCALFVFGAWLEGGSKPKPRKETLNEQFERLHEHAAEQAIARLQNEIKELKGRPPQIVEVGVIVDGEPVYGYELYSRSAGISFGPVDRYGITLSEEEALDFYRKVNDCRRPELTQFYKTQDDRYVRVNELQFVNLGLPEIGSAGVNPRPGIV